MKFISHIFVFVVLAGCTTTEIVGQYPIYGVVSSKCNGEEINGVSISLRFGAVDMGGDNTVITEPVYTTENGEFYIAPQHIKLTGGVGGWSGSLDKWPTLLLHKRGYQDIGYGFLEASETTYKSMVLKMEPTGGCP